MKILHYVAGLNNGGIETMLVNLVNLQIQTHEVAIMVLTDNILDTLVNKVDRRVRIIRVGKPIGSKNIFYVLKANRQYWQYRPDVFHFHEHNSPKFFPWKRHEEKRFATIHNMIPTTWNKSIDKYIAISECVKDGFIKQTGKDNCEVLYNGINLTAIKTKTDYADTPNRFLTIGRLYPSKGMDIVIKAFVCLKEEGQLRGCKLDIWGEGQERKAIEDMVVKNNLQDVINLCGNMDSIYVEKHICDYDCVLQASRHEGFGLTAIEAMAAGVPTILTNIEGYAEVSKNGEYSMLFSLENPQSLAKRIKELRNDYGNAKTRALKAKEYVRRNYSVETLNEKLNDLYNRK